MHLATAEALASMHTVYFLLFLYIYCNLLCSGGFFLIIIINIYYTIIKFIIAEDLGTYDELMEEMVK